MKHMHSKFNVTSCLQCRHYIIRDKNSAPAEPLHKKKDKYCITAKSARTRNIPVKAFHLRSIVFQ